MLAGTQESNYYDWDYLGPKRDIFHNDFIPVAKSFGDFEIYYNKRWSFTKYAIWKVGAIIIKVNKSNSGKLKILLIKFFFQFSVFSFPKLRPGK